MAFIPEITTTWNVTVHDERLDESLDLLKNDKILSVAGDEVLERLLTAKSDLENFGHEVAKAIGETQQGFQERFIRENKSIRTGLMLDSIEMTEEGLGTVSVGNSAYSPEGFPYPLAIEHGRGPVYPVKAKVLRWWDKGGNIVFAKSAGPAAARPFVAPSQEYTSDKVEEIVDKYVKEVFG